MNTLNITKLTFDVSSLGPEALLTAVRPYYAYLDGERTSTVDGYKYTTPGGEAQPPQPDQGDKPRRCRV